VRPGGSDATGYTRSQETVADLGLIQTAYNSGRVLLIRTHIQVSWSAQWHVGDCRAQELNQLCAPNAYDLDCIIDGAFGLNGDVEREFDWQMGCGCLGAHACRLSGLD
jgi:hypothetical protein